MPDKVRLSRYEITGYVLIIFGVLVLILGTVKLNLFQELYSSPDERTGALFGEYGEFIGGIVGSLWALAGVFLFFATLTYQKREFELQRFELHKTHKIFQQQNFSTLFISFLQKHNEIIDALTAYDISNSPRKGNSFFAFFQEKVLSSFTERARNFTDTELTEANLNHLFQEYFTYHFALYQNSLEPYLKNLSILFLLIQKYRSETQDESEYYSFITKTGFSQAELFLLFHAVKYNLLSNAAMYADTFKIFEDLQEQNKSNYYVKQELSSV